MKWFVLSLALCLTACAVTDVSMKVKEGNWTNVDGGFNKNGFNKLLKNVGNVGFTFGGGYFMGHGVSVSEGNAKFFVTSFTIK